MVTHSNLDMLAFLTGVLAASGCYNDEGIVVWAPKEHSILLDYLEDAFGGKIIKQKKDKYKWILETKEADLLAAFLSKEMPQCEGRSSFVQWYRDSKHQWKKQTVDEIVEEEKTEDEASDSSIEGENLLAEETSS